MDSLIFEAVISGLTFHVDADFDQVGEIFNIPVVGHYVRYLPPPEPLAREISRLFRRSEPTLNL